MKHKDSFTWVGLESVHPYSDKGKTCPEPEVPSDADSLMHHHSPFPCQSCILQSQSANEWKIIWYLKHSCYTKADQYRFMWQIPNQQKHTISRTL